jgi:hypothetical protein
MDQYRATNYVVAVAQISIDYHCIASSHVSVAISFCWCEMNDSNSAKKLPLTGTSPI